MSNGKLIHRIFIGVYCPPVVEPTDSDRWLFEDGSGVLTEANENLIQE